MKRGLIISLSLESSINDAAYIKRLMIDRGYNVVCLIESQATRHKISKYMSWLFRSNNIFLYFSGHGKDKSLLCYDGILPLVDINIPSRCKGLILLDCCNVGDMKTSLTIIRNKGLAYDSVIGGIRRGLLTYHFLGTISRYNYTILIEELKIELACKLKCYNQEIVIGSSDEILDL